MTNHHHKSKFHPHGTATGSESGRHLDAEAGATPEQREHMIAEAAYYIAEHREFQGNDPVSDWLQAQTDIDSRTKREAR
ncbi:MAG: DUF2934 domain-containing protein [Gammaproteobacteria bacterium]